jgi:hypothetical protein
MIAEAKEQARGNGEEGERTQSGERGEMLAGSEDKASRRRSRRIDDPEEVGPQSLQRRRVVLLEDDDEEDRGEVPTAPPPAAESEAVAPAADAHPDMPPLLSMLSLEVKLS